MICYQFFPGDFARDTGHLSLAEDGAYRRLLDHYYATGGPLPADWPALYRICRAQDETERQAVESVATKFFVYCQSDGRLSLRNKRADKELQRYAERHEKLSNSAKKALRNRWSKAVPESLPAYSQPIAEPEPEPKPKEEKKKPSANAVSDSLPVADGFEDFYKAYPKHVGKEAARRAWRKVKPEEKDAILARVELNKIGEWAGKEKQYIPNPASWLNGQRWTDEILGASTNGNRNAKPTVGDAMRTTLDAFRQLEAGKAN